ncbi:UBL4A protein, partial [Polyodon spathula]|nr:UBL4A protein [Polyodon spathula]
MISPTTKVLFRVKVKLLQIIVLDRIMQADDGPQQRHGMRKTAQCKTPTNTDFQDYKQSLRLLSLDDMERLATRMLHPEAVECMELPLLD